MASTAAAWLEAEAAQRRRADELEAAQADLARRLRVPGEAEERLAAELHELSARQEARAQEYQEWATEKAAYEDDLADCFSTDPARQRRPGAIGPSGSAG